MAARDELVIDPDRRVVPPADDRAVLVHEQIATGDSRAQHPVADSLVHRRPPQGVACRGRLMGASPLVGGQGRKAGGQVPETIGHYETERVLGSGAFATVWLARDPRLDAQVAIKILAENWAHDDNVRQRFAEEARVLWRLDSDRAIRVHLVDELEDGRPYFVMDYADRGSLADRMAERAGAGPPYTIDEAIAIAIEIADALAVVHRLGVVHRDLKPSNVLYRTIGSHHGDTRTERMVLADFGVARALDSASAFTIAAGTPHYMAPEQSEGRADERSDVYAAGVVLYELLAGRVPYPYPSVGAVMRAQLTETPAPISSIRDDAPASLDAVIGRALSPEPDQRVRVGERLGRRAPRSPRIGREPRSGRHERGRDDHPSCNRPGRRGRGGGCRGIRGGCCRIGGRRRTATADAASRTGVSSEPRHPRQAADRSVAATVSSPPRSWSC